MKITTEPQPEAHDQHLALRPTFEELCQNARLLIRLRWVAGFGILFGTAIASVLLDISLQVGPLLIIGGLVLSYNALLAVACRDDISPAGIETIAWGQILLDWLAMIALVHFTGGITSPALIYFVLHAALSGMVLLPWQVRSLAVLAVLMVGGLAWAERAGLIGLNLLFILLSPLMLVRRWRERLALPAYLGLLAATLWVTSILQTLPDHGDNPRFLIPMQSLVVLWGIGVAGALYTFYRHRAAQSNSPHDLRSEVK
jgi:hypothetical protein